MCIGLDGTFIYAKRLVGCIVVVGEESIDETPGIRLGIVFHSYVVGWMIVLARCVSLSLVWEGVCYNEH